MYNIAVGIPTHKRPAMLEQGIVSVLNNVVSPSLIAKVHVIVVDNDESKTAQDTVSRLNSLTPHNFELHYHSFPVKGLSNVRNEIFKQALKFGPDFIACFDDDEYTTAEWLNEMILTITSNSADAVIGPVIPKIEEHIPAGIAYHFTYHKIANNKRIYFLETNNYIIRTSFLLKHQLEFDQRFNFSGSEDNFFGVQALKKGARIYWAAKAVTYENIPEKRATLKWLIMRNYRSSLTFIYVLLLERDYAKVFKKLSTSLAYSILGVAALIFLPFNIKYKYWGPVKIATALGGFAGLLNLKYYEYQKDLKA